MLYDYILKNYEKDEPIFLSELPGDSRDYVRQEMKKLVDNEKLNVCTTVCTIWHIRRFWEQKGRCRWINM